MYKLFVVSCLIVVAFAKPLIIESGIPVVKTVVQQPGTVSVQHHTIESVGQHVHNIPTAVSSQRKTIVQKTVSHVTPTIYGNPAVIRTPSIVGAYSVVGTPSLVSSPPIHQSYASPISRTTVLKSEPTLVSHL